MTLTGIILVHLADAIDKLHHIRLLAMQLQLLLIYLTNIENLVHQIQDTLGIMLYGINIAQSICLISTCKATLQISQRTHDKGQRRADIMGGIDEELHFLFIHLLGSTTAIGHKYKDSQRHQNDEIDEICQLRSVPRCTDSKHHLFFGSVLPTLLGANMNMIGTRLQVA